MSDVTDSAISFEAVKTSINQNKDGVILRLAIHPQECPPELLAAWVGARFYVAMVEIGDDEQPKINEEAIRRQRLVQSAGMLGSDPLFAEFMMATGAISEATEAAVAQAMREILGVASRAELRTNDEAAKRFVILRNDFIKWRDNKNT